MSLKTTNKITSLLSLYLNQESDRLSDLVTNKRRKYENFELEIRYGTKNIKHISKIDFDNLVSKLLSSGFEITYGYEPYTLKIQNEFLATNNRRISTVRTEISGLDAIQEYCRTNGLPENPHQAGIIFTQKKYFNKGQNVYYPVNFDDFNFRASLQTEKNISESSELLKDLIQKWSDNKKLFRYMKRTSLTHKDYPFSIDLSIVKESRQTTSRYQTEYTIKDSKSRCPAIISVSVVKCKSLCFPLSAPQNEASIVKILGMPSSLNIAILAVPSFALFIENRDYSKEK